jgi:large subunit ribosomal protein L24
MHIHSNDTVEVISGADRGTRAKVLRILARKEKVIVEGVRRVYKHMRRSQQNPQGGRLSKEMPFSISNVMLICPACGKTTRTGVKRHEDGSKYRICRRKTCGKEIGQIAPSHQQRAASAAAAH